MSSHMMFLPKTKATNYIAKKLAYLGKVLEDLKQTIDNDKAAMEEWESMRFQQLNWLAPNQTWEDG